ncbi:MAG: TraM recognition domain-containing protein, partial [bacterium]|nr:TraM recognition domain-containing protein [bacterium]
NSRLLGALLITKLQLAVMSRVDIPEEKRQDFFLYVDEFQNFATQSFTNILSEARKYRLSLILGHQYITQMEEEVRDAVFGNVGTIVVFRVGAEDAEYLEKEFAPEFVAEDLVNLPKYNIDLKLMIDGVAGSAFSAETLPPLPKLEESNREKIIKASRERYSIPRKIVEEKIAKWTGMLNLPEAPLQESRQVLYDAKCSLCGKWTKVIFEPSASRPVYCKTCLKKVRDEGKEGKPSSSPFAIARERWNSSERKEIYPTRAAAKGEEEDLSSSPALSLQEAIDKEPVSFSGRKEGEESKLSSSPFAKAREVEKSKEGKERKRKEVNLEELKKTLEESLREIKPEKEDEGFKKV